ncbi:MAG: putative lipid II flippase FtsW [Candidatus Aminicenantes bacterium]|nr:putative lipid II flippase FtsW [Candidatus Aminicenantes bacterium]
MVRRVGIDRILMGVMAMLILIGLIMAYSSTMILAKEKYGDSFYFLKRQLLWLTVGLIVFAVVVMQKRAVYLNPAIVYAFVLLAVVGLTLVFFSGKINGTYRWLHLAGFSLQPSEFAKVAGIMYLALALGRRNVDVNHLPRLTVILIPFLVMEILILKEPDYGTFFLLALIAVAMLFVAGLKLRYLFVLALAAMPVGYLLLRLDPERMQRIMAFLNPEKYLSTFNFQGVQSLYAVGSGGIFGQGLGSSTQKLFFLPYAYTDFIFAIIAEEVGLIGCLLVIGLFGVFLKRGLNIARNSGHRQAYLLVTGLTFLLVAQAFINISVTIGIFPTKGIALPFISIGGSSLISAMLIAGIITNVSRHGKTVFAND